MKVMVSKAVLGKTGETVMSKVTSVVIVISAWILSIGFTIAIAQAQEEVSMTEESKLSPPGALAKYEIDGDGSYYVMKINAIQPDRSLLQPDGGDISSDNGDYYFEYNALQENGKEGYSKGNYSLWFKRLHFIPEGDIYRIETSTVDGAYFTNGEMVGHGWTAQEWMPGGYSNDESNRTIMELFKPYLKDLKGRKK
jgi:hypothetical protein